MPDKDGKLTAEEGKKLRDWLQAKTKNYACPVCHTNAWSLGEHLLNGTVFVGGNLIVGGPAYPMAFTVCNNCAYTRTFMAVPIGLLPKGDGNG